MKKKHYILSIDLGTTAVKAALVDRSGQALSTGSTPLRLIQSDDGTAEQDGRALWEAVLESSRQALDGDVASDAVVAVAVGAQYSSIIPVDENNEPLMNMVMWKHHKLRLRENDPYLHIQQLKLLALISYKCCSELNNSPALF